jgi:hypothetical protein
MLWRAAFLIVGLMSIPLLLKALEALRSTPYSRRCWIFRLKRTKHESIQSGQRVRCCHPSIVTNIIRQDSQGIQVPSHRKMVLLLLPDHSHCRYFHHHHMPCAIVVVLVALLLWSLAVVCETPGVLIIHNTSNMPTKDNSGPYPKES